MFLVMDKMSFSGWLSSQMKERDWSQSDLSRASGISRSIISKMVNGDTKPVPETLESLARGLRLPTETVYRAAGLLPPVAERRAKLEELALVAGDLDDDEIEDLIDIAKMRAKKRKDKQGNIAKTSRSKRPARNALISK